MKYSKYLRSFVIASSGIITIPYQMKMNDAVESGRARYSYYDVTIVTPISFGLWNVGSLIVSEYYGLSTQLRILLVTISHWLATIIAVKYFRFYSYTEDKNRMIKYSIMLFIFYFIHWNIVIYLEKIL